ncbi:hypothetical protein BK671_20425 [Pseudomonas fluorescens]|uniref:Uncharacterized protein n=1 Tax=Pseudomonas fluorescens TaxID=294 RepID=A0A423L6N9_PSEFL|nr:hypothetical protein BK671_20425 [Pseudomonas fluorescens]
MSWEKVGKSLVALIGCIGSIVAIHAALKDDTKLEAYLTYDYQSYPRQFSERVNKASDKLGYGYLYDGVKSVANGALSHEQIDKIVSLSQAPYLYMFDGPFEKGPNVYPAGLYIYLQNTGEKVVKDVHIKLPAKGLVRIRDDSSNDTVMDEPTSRVVIPSLVQNGVYRVWVYFDGDLKALKKEGVHIGYSDGVAKIEVFEEFSGFEAGVAKYSRELTTLLVMLAMLLILAVVVLFMVISDDRRQANSTAG